MRTPAEYGEGRIAGAVNIDYRGADFAAKLGELDRDTSYLVHCRSGRRSTNSMTTFKELGFKSVYHLDGGILAWQEAGQPVEK